MRCAKHTGSSSSRKPLQIFTYGVMFWKVNCDQRELDQICVTGAVVLDGGTSHLNSELLIHIVNLFSRRLY